MKKSNKKPNENGAAPHDPRPPPAPGAGGSDPDRQGTWHRPDGTERTGAGLRHRDHIEGPGHVRPGHVRAGRSSQQSSSLPMISKRRSPSSGLLPGTRPSLPSSGSGRSTGRGGSSWSHPDSLVEIDREGKRLVSEQTVAYVTGTPISEEGVSPS